MVEDRQNAATLVDARTVEGAPFDEIMTALEDLSEGETLELRNGFEPEPLYDVLTERGFAYEAERVDDEWRVRISHVDRD